MEMFSLTCLSSVLLAHGNPGKKRIFYFFAINSLPSLFTTPLSLSGLFYLILCNTSVSSPEKIKKGTEGQQMSVLTAVYSKGMRAADSRPRRRLVERIQSLCG